MFIDGTEGTNMAHGIHLSYIFDKELTFIAHESGHEYGQFLDIKKIKRLQTWFDFYIFTRPMQSSVSKKKMIMIIL